MFDDFVSTFDLGLFSDEERRIMEAQKIDFRKQLSKVISESRRLAKQEKCYICGKVCSSFCKSHSIPAFCLRNITDSGDVLTMGSVIDFPLIDNEKGVGEAGVFFLICNDCDSKVFSDYETPSNYLHKPTPKMIAQIAMKNYLKFIYKRLLERQMYEVMCSTLNFPKQLTDTKLSVNALDLKEYIDGFNKAKRALDKGLSDTFYMCYYEKLNYVVPLAFQSLLSLIVGFDGEIINDVYNQSPKYCLKPIHICIFPLETESVLFMFVESGDNRYRKFYKAFNKLSLDDKLATLTFIICAYSEEMFYSDKIESEVKGNSQLKNTSQVTSDILAITPFFDPYKKATECFDLAKRNEIPNLLAEKYKIK